MNRAKSLLIKSKSTYKPFFVITLFALLLLSSCKLYKASPTTLYEVRSEKQITENMDVYEFYIQDGEKSYRLEEAKFTQNGELEGIWVETPHEIPDTSWDKKATHEYYKAHPHEVNINYKEPYSRDGGERERVKVETDKIESMSVTAVDKEKGMSKLAIVALIVLGAIITVGLISLVLIASINASANGSEGSSEGSIESNSNGGESSGDGSSGS